MTCHYLGYISRVGWTHFEICYVWITLFKHVATLNYLWRTLLISWNVILPRKCFLQSILSCKTNKNTYKLSKKRLNSLIYLIFYFQFYIKHTIFVHGKILYEYFGNSSSLSILLFYLKKQKQFIKRYSKNMLTVL